MKFSKKFLKTAVEFVERVFELFEGYVRLKFPALFFFCNLQGPHQSCLYSETLMGCKKFTGIIVTLKVGVLDP